MFTLAELEYLLFFQRFSRNAWGHSKCAEQCRGIGRKIEALIATRVRGGDIGLPPLTAKVTAAPDLFTRSELEYLLLFQRFSRGVWKRSRYAEQCKSLGEKIEALIAVDTESFANFAQPMANRMVQ